MNPFAVLRVLLIAMGVILALMFLLLLLSIFGGGLNV